MVKKTPQENQNKKKQKNSVINDQEKQEHNKSTAKQ
jgi:hypothetical protein